jgi:tripartite-type tricarboxylate transporter receptor subunit TctC
MGVLMMKSKMLASAAIVLAAAIVPAAAQDWPTRPISMIVPYAAGGPPDVIARIIAPGMSDSLGVQVVVENVSGAGGITGTARVARAAPDGYTFLLGAAGVLSQNQTLYKHPPYNSITDFAPVGLIALTPAILVARPNFPANDLREFIAYARANQSKLLFASGGAGSGGHIACLLLNTAIGVSVTHVPYRGSGRPDLMAGRIDYMCDFSSTALPEIEAKQVKALAVLARERMATLPDLATADEQGIADFDATGWYAFVAPARTPGAIVRRLNKAMSDALDGPVASERYKRLGNTVALPPQRSPEYLGKFIRSEIDKWAGPIRASGVALE